MPFSSNLFIFFFLPLFVIPVLLVTQFVSHSGIRNGFLVVLSLFFFYWASGKYIAIFLAVIAIGYIAGLVIDRNIRPQVKRLIVGVTILVVLLALFYFKYTEFAFTQLAHYVPTLPTIATIALPLGISFYTFQTIAYVMDIYRQKTKAEKNPIHYGLYQTFFPKLLQGPIVRFDEIASQLRLRTITADDLFEGAWRFSLGLAKKVIIADNVGAVATTIFDLPHTELTTGLAWLGMICYTIQIYFVFSGYTDMAIGIGRCFGFRLPENFDLPYRATSITQFWRKWHMTLSRWLRDYVYIPLGGSKKGSNRTYINLLLVFLVCGIWHGSAWTFIAWGVYHGILLVVERFIALHTRLKAPILISQLVTLLLIMIGWVIFRSASLTVAWYYIQTLFGLHQATIVSPYTFHYFFQKDTLFYLLVGIFFAFFQLSGRLPRLDQGSRNTIVRAVIMIVLLTLSVLTISQASFTPFLYFRF